MRGLELRCLGFFLKSCLCFLWPPTRFVGYLEWFRGILGSVLGIHLLIPRIRIVFSGSLVSRK